MITKTWTPAARAALERTLSDHHARLVGTGVDADEVVADLRRHVEAELAADADEAVDVTEVEAVMRRVLGGTAEPDQPAPTPLAATVAALGTRAAPRLRKEGALWMFLVVLPALTLGFELVTGLCGLEFFDPIGSIGRLLAVAAVPAIFGTILASYQTNWFRPRARSFLALAGFACGISAYYAVLFLPLTPFAVMGIIVFGLGFLPLSPLLACLLSTSLLRQLARMFPAPAGRRRRAWLAVPAGLLALLAIDAGPIVTTIGLRWYAADDPAVHARGRDLLRSPWVSIDRLRSHARDGGRPNFVASWLGDFIGGESWSRGDAEEAFFAATGRSVEDTPASKSWRAELGLVGRGGRDLSAPLEAREFLALTASRLDGQVEADALVGYVEWTATLSNSAGWPLEGRAILQLPPGGVVSRVTLWVNGEEREAAFAGRAQATRAYESVAIVQRRDPILVTTAGPDRVRIRCFPVPARGDMKFRIGITFPLVPAANGTEALVALPQVAWENFRLPEGFEHQVWYESGTRWIPPTDDLTRDEGGDRATVRGALRHDRLAGALLRATRDPAATVAWAEAQSPDQAVLQRLVPNPAGAGTVAVVIDGSSLVWREHADAVLGILDTPAEFPVQVWFALDAPVALTFARPAEARTALAEAWRRRALTLPDGRRVALPRRGGFDNSVALAQALAAGNGGPHRVYWIHGTQCGGTYGAAVVRQALERRRGAVELVAVPVEAVRADLLQELDGRPEVRTIPLSFVEQLRAELAAASGAASGLRIERELVTRTELPAEARLVAGRHVTRLWAAEQASTLLARGTEFREQAIALASAHQLVTPATGAVVLETLQQYAEHGLTPVNPSTVPTIPDRPSVWVLVLAAIVVLAVVWRARRERRRIQAQSPMP